MSRWEISHRLFCVQNKKEGVCMNENKYGKILSSSMFLHKAEHGEAPI